MNKLIRRILSWFGIYRPGKWSECVKSSNWHGANASQRMMNMLSPSMKDSTYKTRKSFLKSRGVDHVHLILCNRKDGECAGYSIYGSNFDWKTDSNYIDVMHKRLKDLYLDGYNIVLWLTTDDSTEWNKKIASNPVQYVKDLKSAGLLKFASMIVIGLECDEYWTAAQATMINSAVKSVWSGKTGVHQTSGKYGYAGTADVMFFQMAPDKSVSDVRKGVANVVTRCGKPVVAFELSRQEDRAKCEAALEAGAFSVGNW